MFGVVQFIRSLIITAFLLGACGTLFEATGCMGKEAANAYRHGGVSLLWLNKELHRRK
jgi:hypothetical protein